MTNQEAYEVMPIVFTYSCALFCFCFVCFMMAELSVLTQFAVYVFLFGHCEGILNYYFQKYRQKFGSTASIFNFFFDIWKKEWKLLYLL